METKKSKVTGVIFDKQGTGKNGVWYSFTVGFENGDSGKYFSNKNPQDYFVTGQEAEYVKEVTQNGQYTNTSIKRPQTAGGKGNFTPSPAAQNRRTALECATRLVVAGKLDSPKVLDMAARFDVWLNHQSPAKPIAPPPPVQQAPPPPATGNEFSEDDLPF